jgi:hypothetical protein
MPALATSPLIFALGLFGEGRARPALAGQAPGFACRVEGAGAGAGAGGDTRTSGARRRRLPLRLTLAGGKPKQRHAGWHARG